LEALHLSLLFNLKKNVYILYIGGEERTIAFLKREGGGDSGEPLLHGASEKGIIHHHFPVNYILKPWRMGVRFYQIIKFGIFQYV
jgi:hypothetical protein